ncbi:hypothetical protein IE53DRAFT_348715 [Violaceomyces palustris]|uniref:Uncharacterized protein n=1 Tax=Violaceomyces palustris TaxID=1673888 RepID=A0ACD0NPM9_9BASI|nr:hypothetical protein IE53DRAFT_348715 [Violaceomyces palustris]
MHSIARTGFDSSGGSGLYDRARPAYPFEAISSILKAATSSTGSPLRIVELGAGTGICTRMLLSASSSPLHDGSPPPGLTYLRAIEPSTGMRSYFQRSIADEETGLAGAMKVKGLLSPNAEVTVEDGGFENFDAGTDNDAVVIAQAFHWCSDFEAAIGQAAKALRSGGILALLWNLEDRETAPWVARLRDLYERYEDGAPQYRHGKWKVLYETDSFKSHFKPETPLHISRRLPTNLESVKERVFSKSYISTLKEEQRQSLGREIDDLFRKATDRELGRVWIDQSKGVWEYVSSAKVVGGDPAPFQC